MQISAVQSKSPQGKNSKTGKGSSDGSSFEQLLNMAGNAQSNQGLMGLLASISGGFIPVQGFNAQQNAAVGGGESAAGNTGVPLGAVVDTSQQYAWQSAAAQTQLQQMTANEIAAALTQHSSNSQAVGNITQTGKTGETAQNALSAKTGMADEQVAGEQSSTDKPEPFSLSFQKTDAQQFSAADDKLVIDGQSGQANAAAQSNAALLSEGSQAKAGAAAGGNVLLNLQGSTQKSVKDVGGTQKNEGAASKVSAYTENGQNALTAVASETGKGSKTQQDSGQTPGDTQGKAGSFSPAAQQTAFAQSLGQTEKTVESSHTSPYPSVASQMSEAVDKAATEGRSELRLHLSPESLGGISIKLVSQNGQMNVQITADNQQTGQLIASGMHELHQSLDQTGLNVVKTEVFYSDTGSFGSNSGSAQQQNRQNSAQQTYKGQVYPVFEDTPAPEQEKSVYVRQGQLNILA